jgi:hypothetical protein
MTETPRNNQPASANKNATGPASPGGGRAALAIDALRTGVVLAGAAFALKDATNLYNRRSGMAAQFQQGLVFPRDLVQNNRDFYVSFSFQEYKKRSINDSPFLRSTGTVRLPLPSNLKDNLSVSYAAEPLGPAVGAALEGVIGTSPSVSGESAFETGLNRFGGALAGGAAGAVAQAAQDAGGAAASAASAYSGMAINPFQTVLFKQPTFKKHSFSWKLMPRDEQESGIIRDLVRTFQFHTSPGVSEGAGLFFSFPSRVIVSLFPSSEFLYRFKPCVIESVDVNYAAGSGPSFFKRSQAPTAVTFSIQMQEIEYWTNNDYEASSFNDITSFINAGGAIVSPLARGTTPTEP